MRSAVFFALVGLVACSTAAPSNAPVPLVQPVATAPALQPAKMQEPKTVSASEKLICRRIAVTGSNYPKKFCSTQAEWDAQEKAALEQSEQIEASRNRADASTVGRAR